MTGFTLGTAGHLGIVCPFFSEKDKKVLFLEIFDYPHLGPILRAIKDLILLIDSHSTG